MQCVMRCARSRSSAHIVFFLPVRLLFPTLLADIFQILNPRLFSSCLQKRQRLKKEERARSQAKCRRTSCDTCPSSCPPEQLGATIAEMGDHARIDVDSPLWDQTTFIGLPSKSAENDLRGKKFRSVPALCVDVEPSQRTQLYSHFDGGKKTGECKKKKSNPTFTNI